MCKIHNILTKYVKMRFYNMLIYESESLFYAYNMTIYALIKLIYVYWKPVHEYTVSFDRYCLPFILFLIQMYKNRDILRYCVTKWQFYVFSFIFCSLYDYTCFIYASFHFPMSIYVWIWYKMTICCDFSICVKSIIS